VPPHQSRFAAAVNQLMNDDNLHARMSKAAAARSEDYSLRSSSERILKIYESVVRF
jgi:glycosyltransferase involved in cell wall biosynthesis